MGRPRLQYDPELLKQTFSQVVPERTESRTIAKIAAKLGVAPPTLKRWMSEQGISSTRVYVSTTGQTHRFVQTIPLGPAAQKPLEPPPKYNVPEIIERLKRGDTLDKIGKEHGVTRERIRQVVAREGYSVADLHARLLARRKAATQKRLWTKKTRRLKRIWDLSVREYNAIVKKYGTSSCAGSPLTTYKSQRGNALQKGSEWTLTFKQWWDIWQNSGRWEQRGLGKTNYVMTRRDLSKGFTPENVIICTHSECSFYVRVHHA